MKKIISLLILALFVNIGYSQKNVILHKADGNNVKTNVAGVDSITFTDYATPGSLTFDTYTDSNFFLEHHSKVAWTASYKGNNSDIAGGFNEMHAEMKFDEANPANISFDGSVRLSTANTFEPGRDDPGHCVNSSLGVMWNTHSDTVIDPGPPADTVITVYYDSTVDASDWATIVVDAGDVVAYGDGYKAAATFTYKGVSTVVDLYLQYLSTNAQSPTRNYHNFEGQFQFLAGTTSNDPYYCGSSIKSMVYVDIHIMIQQEL
jgi:polyisoprenoid-binding protein YceI